MNCIYSYTGDCFFLYFANKSKTFWVWFWQHCFTNSCWFWNKPSNPHGWRGNPTTTTTTTTRRQETLRQRECYHNTSAAHLPIHLDPLYPTHTHTHTVTKPHCSCFLRYHGDRAGAVSVDRIKKSPTLCISLSYRHTQADTSTSDTRQTKHPQSSWNTQWCRSVIIPPGNRKVTRMTMNNVENISLPTVIPWLPPLWSHITARPFICHLSHWETRRGDEKMVPRHISCHKFRYVWFCNRKQLPWLHFVSLCSTSSPGGTHSDRAVGVQTVYRPCVSQPGIHTRALRTPTGSNLMSHYLLTHIHTWKQKHTEYMICVRLRWQIHTCENVNMVKAQGLLDTNSVF